MTPTTAPEGPSTPAETAGQAQLRALLHSRDLARLLDRRPDLAGVHGPADTMAATLTWCA